MRGHIMEAQQAITHKLSQLNKYASVEVCILDQLVFHVHGLPQKRKDGVSL